MARNINLMSEDSLKLEILELNKIIEEKNEQYRTLEMYMPSVHKRQIQVLGRQLSRLNYKASNKMAELNKLVTEHK